MPGATCQMHSAAPHLDEEQDVEAYQPHRFNREEVDR
jgi:hypothetical protein